MAGTSGRSGGGCGGGEPTDLQKGGRWLADGPHELRTQPGFALVVPTCCFRDVGEGVRADFEVIAHSP
jgi:hypothetical protein